MPSRNRLVSAAVVLLLGFVPCLAQSQLLSDLLKLVPKSTSANNLIGAIKSLSDITVGQVEPGAGPENAEGKVILYRTAWCPYCKRAAAYMQKKNVGFVERDIETNPGYKAEFSRLGGKGVPLIVFREKTMSGFDEATFEHNYADFKRATDSAPGPSVAAPAASNNSPGNQAIQSGDMLLGKIGGISVYMQPAKGQKLTAISRDDEMIYMGEERDGFYRVTTQKGEGWIDKLLVRKK